MRSSSPSWASSLIVQENLVEWWQPEDEKQFPDIEAKSASGWRVGVELSEWLNEGEMRTAEGIVVMIIITTTTSAKSVGKLDCVSCRHHRPYGLGRAVRRGPNASPQR